MLKKCFDLLIPNHCAGCDQTLLEGENTLCMACYHQLDLIPIATQSSNNILMQQLFGKVSVKQAQAILYYDKDEGITQRMIKNLKYKGQENIGDFLADLCWDRHQKTQLFDNIDYLCCVPLHPQKQRKRGYNQLHRFTKKLSKLSNIPFQEKLLVRNIHDESQTTKNIFTRSLAKKSKFGYRQNLIDPKSNLLLIDDVITTGSTIEQMIKTMRQHHTGDISVLCMAATYST